jgi:hypothetical protein
LASKPAPAINEKQRGALPSTLEQSASPGRTRTGRVACLPPSVAILRTVARAETFTWSACGRQFHDALHPIPRSAWQPLKRRVPNAAS